MFPEGDYHILKAGVNPRVLEFGSLLSPQYRPLRLLFVLFWFLFVFGSVDGV